MADSESNRYFSPLQPTDDAWRARYNEVLDSFRWKALRKRLIKERGWKCERCGFPAAVLQLHHLNYERLGEELDSDLQVVCEKCHPEADQERATESRRKTIRAREARALDTWASKKYGDSWSERGDADRISDDFDRWLERQG